MQLPISCSIAFVLQLRPVYERDDQSSKPVSSLSQERRGQVQEIELE